MLGKTISHYRVLAKLGGGGMGVVYLAEDQHLDRRVALKFLPPHLSTDPTAKQRFILEAKAASALDHPNICTIHDIDEADDGQLFIAMACYEGATLKKRLESGSVPTPEAIDIVAQIAAGLGAAHEKGIIHRDVKPANVFLTRDGRAILLDFGLAKLAGALDVTAPGSTLGTAAYMSPEQARGETVDHRTDIWSLGVVFHEMLSGRKPFAGEYEQAIVYAILNQEPKPFTGANAESDRQLAPILEKLLSKDPADRYRAMNDVITDLRSFAGGDATGGVGPVSTHAAVADGAGGPLSIAVLPFTDMSKDKDHEYFCDGIAEELINALSHIERWKVVSRTSAFSFKHKELDVRDIGSRLSASHVLEGSLRKAGPRIRVTARLTGTRDGYQLWSRQFDGRVDDIFEIQEEIAQAVLDQLQASFGGTDRRPADTAAHLARRSTENMEAYSRYLQARFHMNKRTDADLQTAVRLCDDVIQLDASFAPAYAGKADALVLLAMQGEADPAQAIPQAKSSASKSLQLDPEMADAHASLGLILAAFEWQLVEAEHSFKRAIELNPSYAAAHQWCGLWCLAPKRLFEESIRRYRLAIDLDPLSPVLGAGLGWVHYLARSYDQAEAQLRTTLAQHQDFVMAHDLLGLTLAQTGRIDEAIEEVEESIELSRGRDLSRAILAYVYGLAKREEMLKGLPLELESRSRYTSPFDLAIIHLALGNESEAVNCLNVALERKNPWLLLVPVDPMWDRMKGNVDFDRIVRTVESAIA